MKKADLYTQELRRIARKLNDGETYSKVIIEDVTGRTEKGFLNKMIPSLELDIKHAEGFGISADIQRKMLIVANSRLAVLNKY